MSKTDKIFSKSIIFLITSLDFGGAEIQLIRLAAALKKRKWDVRIITMVLPDVSFLGLIHYDIPIYSLNMVRRKVDVCALFRLAKILRKERPTILHSHMVHANFLARVVRLIAYVPVVVCTAHNIYEGNVIRDWWYWLTDCLCDMTTHVSKAGLRRYLDRGMVNPKKAMFIPNGVDTEVFQDNSEIRQQIRTALNAEHRFVWLAIGRFEEAKDYPNMINAFARVCDEKIDSILWIAGDGFLKSKIERLVGKLGINNKVRFLGIRQDIPNLMNAADAYVMSSAWEGMPMVLLEAASCSLPIVATSVGDNREIVKEGKTGFLVPFGNSKKLADAMVTVEKLPIEKRYEIGQAGRKFVEEAYSLEYIVDKWENLYRQLMPNRRFSL